MDDKDRLIPIAAVATLAAAIAAVFATQHGLAAAVAMWFFAGLAIAGFIVLPWSWYPRTLSRVWSRMTGPQPSEFTEKPALAGLSPVEIRPVQGPGNNWWKKIPDEEHSSLTDPERFMVKLRLMCWTRSDAELVNLHLAYDWPGTAPERQYCEIDGTRIDFDASYRFKSPVSIPAGKSAEITIWREFRTARVIGNSTDYRTAWLRFEIATAGGLLDLSFAGTLRPGGEIADIEIRQTGTSVP